MLNLPKSIGAFLVAAALSGVAFAQEGGTPQDPAGKPAAQPPAARAMGGQLEPAQLDALGSYADTLFGASLDENVAGPLLFDETAYLLKSKTRGGIGSPGTDKPGADKPGDMPGRSARREPLTAWVKAKIAEGLKGPELVSAIQAEESKRREATGPEGRPGDAGGAVDAAAKGHDKVRLTSVEVTKKLREKGLKGRAFADAFVADISGKIDGGLRRPGETPKAPEKPGF